MKRIVIAVVAASVCIAGQLGHTSHQELAMAKCSKSIPSDGMDKGDDEEQDNGASTAQKKKKSPVAMGGKSAAKKVLEGVNGPCKSAARRSMEIEQY